MASIPSSVLWTKTADGKLVTFFVVRIDESPSA